MKLAIACAHTTVPGFTPAIDSDRPVTEVDLVRSAESGDVAAFERLYRENSGRIYGLCLRMSGNVSAAEELTQAVFVRAWNKLGSFKGRSAFSSWLYRLAVNVVLSERRSWQRHQARIVAVEDPTVFEHATSGGRRDSRLDLDRAIASLPDKARQVFVLHDVEGYRHREIGEIMNIATGTSKAHLHRARRLLREALNR